MPLWRLVTHIYACFRLAVFVLHRCAQLTALFAHSHQQGAFHLMTPLATLGAAPCVLQALFAAETCRPTAAALEEAPGLQVRLFKAPSTGASAISIQDMLTQAEAVLAKNTCQPDRSRMARSTEATLPFV